MIRCECGWERADAAQTCPRCGRAAVARAPLSVTDRRLQVAGAGLVAIALIVLAAAFGFLAGRGLGSVGSGSPSHVLRAVRAETPAPEIPPLDAVAESTLTRVVTIESEGTAAESLGTGWLIDMNGDFVTNAHVVSGHLAVRIVDATGHTHSGLVMGADAGQDVAVVRSADGFAATPLTVVPRTPAVPQPVAAVASARSTGHAAWTDETLTQLGVDVPISGVDLGPGVTPSTTVYSQMMVLQGAQIFPGNSGGPVVDQQGEVVGIVTLASQEKPQAYAIPIGRVASELNSFAARQSPGA